MSADLLNSLDRFSDSTENLSLYIMQIAKLADQMNRTVGSIVSSIDALEKRISALEDAARR